MAAEARISTIWRYQKLFLSIFFIVIGLYFFYDGFIGWPRSNERWEAHHGFEIQGGEGWQERWKAYAATRGWKETPPKKYYGTPDLVTQYVFGGLFFVPGVLLLLFWFNQRNTVLRSDDEAVYTPAGTRVPFTNITGIGKKRWESKGIATVRYEDQGRKRQFVVDDYKFEQEPARKIVEEIEEHLLARAAAQEALTKATPVPETVPPEF